MPDVGPFSAPWRCAAVGRDRSAQVLDRGRGAATRRREAGGVPDRDDREGDPPVHREPGRPGGTVGLLRGRAGRVRIVAVADEARRRVRCGRAVADPGPRWGPRQDRPPRREKARIAVRAGMVRFVHPPTPELEGLRDLLRARDDVRGARMAARNRVLKQLLRHGRIFREGKGPGRSCTVPGSHGSASMIRSLRRRSSNC
jgi:hypothetical protein